MLPVIGSSVTTLFPIFPAELGIAISSLFVPGCAIIALTGKSIRLIPAATLTRVGEGCGDKGRLSRGTSVISALTARAIRSEPARTADKADPQVRGWGRFSASRR